MRLQDNTVQELYAIVVVLLIQLVLCQLTVTDLPTPSASKWQLHISLPWYLLVSSKSADSRVHLDVANETVPGERRKGGGGGQIAA